MVEFFFIILRGFLIVSWVNPDRILHSQLIKISEQEFEEILNRILFHLEKSWKQELLGFRTRSWKIFSGFLKEWTGLRLGNWFKRFREGDLSLEEHPRSGCPPRIWFGAIASTSRRQSTTNHSWFANNAQLRLIHHWSSLASNVENQ